MLTADMLVGQLRPGGRFGSPSWPTDRWHAGTAGSHGVLSRAVRSARLTQGTTSETKRQVVSLTPARRKVGCLASQRPPRRFAEKNAKPGVK